MKLMAWLCQTSDREVRVVRGRVAKIRVKIILLPLSLMAAVLGAGLALAETKNQPSKPEPFHVARTPAEKTLDDLLRRADQDKNIFHYVLGTPYYDTKKDTGYSRLFTKTFLRAAAKKESDLVKKSCGGKYTGEICGLDFSPITCAQDFSESGYLYRTMEDDGRQAIISSLGVDFEPSEVKTSYRLIKVEDHWRLDGVHCGGGGEFNMDCGNSMCADASDLRKKAEQGDAGAQYDLGYRYEVGRGVKWNYGEAARWFRKAAGQGHADAQYYLGDIYEVGRGVPQDDAEAARWYRMAAEQGNVHAQNNLGSMYDKGQGVQQNYAKAARWYRMAAELGHRDAQYRLGLMYEKGLGVQRNLDEAEMWLRKAAKRGHAEARQEVEKLDRR